MAVFPEYLIASVASMRPVQEYVRIQCKMIAMGI